MKRFLLLFLCAALIMLSGCGMFSGEYVVVGDYTPAVPDSSSAEGRVTVRSLGQLRQVLLELVSRGQRESSILFDPAYEGDINEDMASACWQVRTQDALCAYCVENISYDLAKIVSYYEAKISIRYSSAVCAPTEVQRMTFSTGIDELIREMMQAGENRRTVLINRSFYTVEGMEELISDVYRADPILSPQKPGVSILMLSGSGTQRLYEIDLDYGMEPDERAQRLEKLNALEPFTELDVENMDQAERALAACAWLAENCRFDPDGASDLYDALIVGVANEEGLAYAYVRLCGLLSLECGMVYGQQSLQNWEDYCWNIVQIGEDFYHVDPAVCCSGDMPGGFLLRDEDMWERCRWDVSAYPRCEGELNWHVLVEGGEAEPTEETGELTEEVAEEAPEEADEERIRPSEEEPESENNP